MAPARGSRKTVVISDDEDTEDILTDDDFMEKAQPDSPLKALKDTIKNGMKKKATKSSPQKPKKNAPIPDMAKSKGTLFSFFNAATQRQQTSSQPSTPPKPSQSKASDLDAIEDGEGEAPLATGSKIALAARKRKQDDTAHLFDVKAYGSAIGSQKFRKTSAESKAPGMEKEVDRRPWMERFAPSNIEELAVHNKKVKDVRGLLEESLSSRARPRLIVLKGPAGTGKTTVVQLLAQSMGLAIKEWRNPVNVDIGSESFISTSAQFEDFVLRSSKFSGLELSTDSSASTAISKKPSDVVDTDLQHILLVEEFPVSLTRSSPILQSFRTTIQSYLSLPGDAKVPPAPVILILSETLLSSSTSSPDTLTPHRLLGPTLLSHPLTAVVEFNPIAPTLLTKALSLIATKESRVSGRRRTPGPAVLSRLAEMGDIRSAVSALEFLCLKGDTDGDWSAKVTFGKAKGSAKGAVGDESLTEREKEALKLVGGREGALGLWHAVGKVVYNKRIDPPKISVKPEQTLPTNGLSTHSTTNGTTPNGNLSTLIPALQLPASHPSPPPHLSHLHRPKIPENNPDFLLLELGTDISTFIAAIHENLPPSCTSSTTEQTLESLDSCLSILSDADALSLDRFASGGGYGTSEGLRQEEIVFHAAVRGSVFWLPYPVKRTEQGKGRGNVMAWPRSLRLWRGMEEVGDLVELVGEEYTGVLRKAAEGKGRKVGETGEAEDREERWLMPSASRKEEVVLELAPYLKMVQEGKKTIGSLRERVRRVTRFETLGMQGLPGAGGGQEEDEDDEGLGAKRERRTRTGKGDASFLGLGVEEDVKGLVLSDDDIVDD
ncbi:Rad17 P-loop domain-containing protein [Elsinoe fawcettii]|nr:Rad17 P-loop domain-containing protein [Elsinoe fawcettii]